MNISDNTEEIRNIWFLENTGYRVSVNLIQPNTCQDSATFADYGDYLHHIYVGKNTAHEMRQACFWTKRANHVIFSENLCYDNEHHGSQEGDGYGMQYGANNVWFIYNRAYNTNMGFRQSSTSVDTGGSVYLVGNTFWDIHHTRTSYSPDGTFSERGGAAIALWRGNMPGDLCKTALFTRFLRQAQISILEIFNIFLWLKFSPSFNLNKNYHFSKVSPGGRYIVDNTFYDVDAGVYVETTLNAPTYIRGNIISEVTASDYLLQIGGNATANTTIEYSDLFDTQGFQAKWDKTIFSTLSSLQTVSSTCPNCIDTDPAFVNAAANDFHLTSGSGAKDKRAEDEVYGIFYANYGIDIRVSPDRTTRPQGSAWDLGAFEYSVLGNLSLIQGDVQVLPPTN